MARALIRTSSIGFLRDRREEVVAASPEETPDDELDTQDCCGEYLEEYWETMSGEVWSQDVRGRDFVEASDGRLYISCVNELCVSCA